MYRNLQRVSNGTEEKVRNEEVIDSNDLYIPKSSNRQSNLYSK